MLGRDGKRLVKISVSVEILPVVDLLCLGVWYKIKKCKIGRGLQEICKRRKAFSTRIIESGSAACGRMLRQRVSIRFPEVLPSCYLLEMMLLHLSIIEQIKNISHISFQLMKWLCDLKARRYQRHGDAPPNLQECILHANDISIMMSFQVMHVGWQLAASCSASAHL